MKKIIITLVYISFLLIGNSVEAEPFPHCQFYGTSSKFLNHPYGNIELHHPEGRSIPSYTLRNEPDYAQPTTLGPFLSLQICHIRAMRDWVTAYSKEAEGRIKLYRQITGVTIQYSPIDNPAYGLYINWRNHESQRPLMELWAQALDVGVFFSPIYNLDNWGALHDMAVGKMCNVIRQEKQMLFDSYNYIAKTLDWELSHYEARPPFPSIPHTTWNGNSWDSDILLKEDTWCPYFINILENS